LKKPIVKSTIHLIDKKTNHKMEIEVYQKNLMKLTKRMTNINSSFGTKKKTNIGLEIH